MQHAHIDISRGLDAERVVLACLDLREDELAAAARAVAAVAAERYRTPRISADDVLELRELTALKDELEHGTRLVDPAADADPPAGDGAAQNFGPGGAGRDFGPGGAAPDFDPGGAGRDFGSGGAAPDFGPGGAAPEIAPGQALRTLVMRPARLSVLRDALAAFVDSRDDADWIGHEDRGPLALVRGMVLPLEQLCADAVRAALAPESHVG